MSTRKTKYELEFEEIEAAVIARKRMGSFAAQFHVGEVGRDFLRRDEQRLAREREKREQRRKLAEALDELAAFFGGAQ
jgi:hypothetical protein